MSDGAGAVFSLILIKPTHYDDDGYPIQWLRSRRSPPIRLPRCTDWPATARRARCSGPMSIYAFRAHDETNTRITSGTHHSRHSRGRRAWPGGLSWGCSPTSSIAPSTWRGLSSMRGCRYAMGGFHVAGCMAMLPELPPEIAEARDMGISLFAGEAEHGRLDEVLRDAFNGKLKPVYDHMNDMPDAGGSAGAVPAAAPMSSARGAKCRASISDAAVRSSARSAPSSTCRGARAAFAVPTIWKGSSASTQATASAASSSPTTTSPATATGRNCSTA